MFQVHSIASLLFTASDASGRYRGQFLFENNHWLGSFAACESMAKIDEMELSFYVATLLIHSPEPMIKVRISIQINSHSMQVVALDNVDEMLALNSTRYENVCE